MGWSVGTPQGGPLWPLLANILLHQLDQELERRGHRFARYADDLIVLVKSQARGRAQLSDVAGAAQHGLEQEAAGAGACG